MSLSRSGLIPDLDLYIAATMRPSEALETHLRSFSIKAHQLKDVRRRADEAGFAKPHRLTVDLVIAFFGVPSTAHPDRLLYDLTIWPEHRFEWRMLDWGGATHEGFMLRETPKLPDWLPLELPAVTEAFVPWRHTRHEVLRLLGEPELDLSWGHIGEWYYGPSTVGLDLVFGFEYGLLQSLGEERGIIDQHRRT